MALSRERYTLESADFKSLLIIAGKRFAIGHGLENVIPVTRSTEDWGWVLGKGCATEYTSVHALIFGTTCKCVLRRSSPH